MTVYSVRPAKRDWPGDSLILYRLAARNAYVIFRYLEWSSQEPEVVRRAIKCDVNGSLELCADASGIVLGGPAIGAWPRIKVKFRSHPLYPSFEAFEEQGWSRRSRKCHATSARRDRGGQIPFATGAPTSRLRAIQGSVTFVEARSRPSPKVFCVPGAVKKHDATSQRHLCDFTKGVGCPHRLMHTGPREAGYCE